MKKIILFVASFLLLVAAGTGAANARIAGTDGYSCQVKSVQVPGYTVCKRFYNNSKSYAWNVKYAKTTCYKTYKTVKQVVCTAVK